MVDDDLQSLGQILRQTRESRACSLEEVERQTRIRVKYLQALESGNFSVLPSAAHAKGFLRNYATFLQLDANAIVAQFAQATGTDVKLVTTSTATHYHHVPPPLAPAEPRSPSSEGESPASEYAHAAQPQPPRAVNRTHIAPEQRVGPGTPLGLASPTSAPQATPRPERQRKAPIRILQSNVFVGVMLVVATIVVVWWVATRLSALSVEDIMPTPEQQTDTLVTTQAYNDLTPSATFEPTSTPVLDTGPLILDRVLLVIIVEQRAWTRVVVDGVTVFEGQAEPGTVLQYEGQESILVRTGNGAALIVTYNQQNIGPLGERGEVVERLFTPSGQITPTPTPTITPTGTSVPSPTPSSTRAP